MDIEFRASQGEKVKFCYMPAVDILHLHHTHAMHATLLTIIFGV